jgi:hypothetical protein
VGGSHVAIGPEGVGINGTMVKVNGSGMVTINGGLVKIN